MSLFSRKKKHSEVPVPSTLAPATDSGLASSQVTRQLQFPTNSQPHLESPQEKQESRPVCPWSAHTPPVGRSPSPFHRHFHALSTSATATGELFLFGGITANRIRNDLYVILTRDFSTTLLKTSGDVPNPLYGHRVVLTGTTLLVWGGKTDSSDQNSQNKSNDDSFYLLNLVSREWTRIVVNGPGPGGRYRHSMTLVGSKLFVFAGWSSKRYFNDIWALDLNYLKSNPFWESYEPAPDDEKPLPRNAHVSVTTGDRIIIFGGYGGSHNLFNDTWSFNIPTRKWTELQCTGSIPSPRAGHGAVLVGDVMYVFGGRTSDGTYLGDLTAFNLSTQRWIAFQDIGPSPRGRSGHAMASDGRRVFVLGGLLSPGAQASETKLIHVLDTKHLDYQEPESDAVNPGGKTAQLMWKSSASNPTWEQPHQPPSSLDAHAAHGAFLFQNATPEELDHPTSRQITREKNPSLNGLLSQPMALDDTPSGPQQEDDDSESSTELLAPDASSEKEVARLAHERIADLERRLSETLTERDRHIAQLTDQLTQKNTLLEQALADAAEAKKHAGLELRGLQAKLDELMLSRGERLRTLEQAKSDLQKATSYAANADERGQPACEHETELAEMRAELEGKKSELEAVRVRLTDAENCRSKSKAGAETLHAQSAAGLVNTDVDQVIHRLVERMRAMEAEMSSRQWNEKSIESMECRNEE